MKKRPKHYKRCGAVVMGRLICLLFSLVILRLATAGSGQVISVPRLMTPGKCTPAFWNAYLRLTLTSAGDIEIPRANAARVYMLEGSLVSCKRKSLEIRVISFQGPFSTLKGPTNIRYIEECTCWRGP